MTALRWIDGQGEAIAGGDRWRLGMKPRFAFAFDAIAFADGAGTLTIGGQVRDLEPAEVAELEAYLGASPVAGPGLVHGVGPDGAYLGLIPRAQAADVALSAPPSASGFLLGMWQPAHDGATCSPRVACSPRRVPHR